MPLIQEVIDRLREGGYYTDLDIREYYRPDEFIKRKEILLFSDNKKPFIVLGGGTSGFERNLEDYRGAFKADMLVELLKSGNLFIRPKMVRVSSIIRKSVTERR